jgi:hypothetical protein
LIHFHFASFCHFTLIIMPVANRRSPRGKALPNKKRNPAEEAEEDGDSPGDDKEAKDGVSKVGSDDDLTGMDKLDELFQ